MAKNPYEDHEHNDSRRRALVETFGSDILVGLATDPEPGTGTTAQAIAQDHYDSLRRAREQEQLAALAADAEVYADDQTRQQVRDAMVQGRPVAASDLDAAERALRRDPNRPRASSAHRLIAQARRMREQGDDAA
jgi:hypothetical protein